MFVAEVSEEVIDDFPWLNLPSNEDSDEERITAANFEARARALDEKAILDAELDAEELRQAALAQGSDDDEVVGENDGESNMNKFSKTLSQSF